MPWLNTRVKYWDFLSQSKKKESEWNSEAKKFEFDSCWHILRSLQYKLEFRRLFGSPCRRDKCNYRRWIWEGNRKIKCINKWGFEQANISIFLLDPILKLKRRGG